MNKSIRTEVLSSVPVQLPAMESALVRAGAEVAGTAGFFVAVGVGVSIGGVAVVGSAVGAGGGVSVGVGTAAVNVSLTARSIAAVAARSGVAVEAARIEVAVVLGGMDGEAASTVAVTSAG